MKLLCAGDDRALKIIQKNKGCEDIPGRLSQFVYAYETDQHILLKHLMTKQVMLLTHAEWDALKSDTMEADAKTELLRFGFLVEMGHDDFSQYGLVLSVLRTLERRKPGIASYTILPTTGCNARCIYCYEEGWQSTSMTSETASAVVDFICRTKRDGKIRLDWFGGEPLCGAGTISSICRQLKSRGINYYSSIITNATLFTPELVREAKEVWHLRRAQISMDGAKKDYEERKQYVQPHLHHYEGAMRAAELLSDAGVRISLRCNYDAENLPRVRTFFEDCKQRFDGRKNVSIYMEQLFQSSGKAENAALYRSASKVAASLDELGLASTVKEEKNLKTHYCMADSGGHSVIIDPEGGLHVCEHDIQGKPIGTVFGSSISWPSTEATAAAECRTCCFLPECTPFRKEKCLLKNAACRMQMAVRTERSLAVLEASLVHSLDVSNHEPEDEKCP